MQEAMLWHKERNGVRCDLCARRCFIAKNKRGFCLVRINKNNKLYSLNYGKLCSVNIDPIEKKPLFHFYPGSKSLSIASLGCNFRCQFCFEPNTRILTNEGPVTLENLFNKGKATRFEDGFVSFPKGHLTVTHTGKASKITKVYKHFYRGKLIVIKPFYLPEIKATPYHEFFVFENGKIKKISAKDITKDHLLVLPKFKVNGKATKTLDLKEILSNHKTEYRKKTKIDEQKAKKILELHSSGKTSREIGKIMNMHPVYIRKLIGKLKKKGIPKDLIYEKNVVIEKNGRIKFKTEKSFVKRFIPLNEDFAALLGYYCAEGFVTKSPRRITSYALVFSFGKHETELIEKTKKLIRKVFNLKPKVIERRTVTTVELQRTSVALLFKMLAGTGSRNKKVPKVILNCENKKTIFSFLKSYFEGDGYRNRNTSLGWTTCSEDLAYGVYYLILKLGLVPSFYKFLPSEKGIIEGRIINQSPFFRVKIYSKEIANSFLNGFNIEKIPPMKKFYLIENENYYFIKIRKISKESYSGFVFNAETEDSNHSYLSNFVSVGNCCNWQISHAVDGTAEEIEGEEYTPDQIVELAEKNNCKSISYTYTEPTIFFEFAFKTAKLAHRSNILNTFVTNGYMTEEAVKKISKYLDATTVDFKASADPEFYKKFMSVPNVKPIFDSLKRMKKQRIFIEITNLVIPQIGDSIEACRNLAQWISSELGSDIPFHILQFFPNHKLLELPPTPTATLEKCIGESRRTGLRYVYIGNVYDHPDGNTYCYNCRELLIKRSGTKVEKINLVKDRCPTCGLRVNALVE